MTHSLEREHDRCQVGRVYVYMFVIVFTIIVLRVMLAGLQYFVFLQGEFEFASVAFDCSD